VAKILEEVKQHWLSENIALAPPPGQAELDKQLIALGVRPTDEIRRVFSTLNGFADDGEMDSECVSFWTLQRMLDGNRRYGVKEPRYIHFADFLIDSHTYAFRQTESDFVAVYCCHYSADHVVKIADSLEEFFEYYLTDVMRLFQIRTQIR
jgi:hypothetical protein